MVILETNTPKTFMLGDYLLILGMYEFQVPLESLRIRC